MKIHILGDKSKNHIQYWYDCKTLVGDEYWSIGDVGIIVRVNPEDYTVYFFDQGNEKVLDVGMWFVGFNDVEACNYTIEELEKVIFDVLDGSRWWEIQEDTGLDKDRCKEIEAIYQKVAKKLGF